MKLKYILMCALAMIGIAMQAQDNVRYEISSTPATEVVEGHIYVLRNRANPEEVLTYSNNIALTTGWGSIPFGNCMYYQSYFIAAGADGFTLPITLTNINDNGDMGYGETEGGTVIGPKRKAADNTVYFTVKDADGQYVLLDKNSGIKGANATKITENAQWIAYEAKEHTQHVWECREGYDGHHVCSLCDQQESHKVPNEDGKCTVCDYTCPEHNYSFNDRASILATKKQGESIMVYECNNCHYQKTMPVETGGECEGNESGHEWEEINYDPTCAMPGYTVHRCYYCNLEYYTDFTDIEPDNHSWIAGSEEHFCNYGCAEHGARANHTMEEGKCTVCGYWPDHTEHQWDMDEADHRCTIPGCEEYGGWEEHTRGENCKCTVCGYQLEHDFQNGTCTACGVTVTVAGTLSFEEENTVTFWNESYKWFGDPTAAPLYCFECDGNGNLTISSDTELSNALLSVFDSNFLHMGTWGFMDDIWIENPGTYYLIPTYYRENEEETKVEDQTITLSWEGETVCQHTDFEFVNNWFHICKECEESFPHSIGEDGECVCGFKCTKHRFYVNAIASVEETESKNDGKIYVVEECEYCQVQGEPKVVDTKSECSKSKNHNHFWVRYTTDVKPTTKEGGIANISCWYCDESYFVRVPADPHACANDWGHEWEESEGNIVCINEDCDITVTPAATLAMGENAGIYVDASVHHYFWDPSTAPLYKFVPETSGPYDFKIKDNASADCKVFIFETNEDDYLDMNIQDDGHYAFEAGKNYYLQFLTTDVDSDRKPVAYNNATIVVSESMQLVIAAAADASGNSEPVVIAKDEQTGEWSTEQNIVLTDGVESFSTPVDFTAPQVDYERLMPNSPWGTLCLPFDITIDAAKPYAFYELTSATSTEVTLTKVDDGTLQAGTPVLVRRNASETGVHFTETSKNGITIKAMRDQSESEVKDGLRMIGVFMPYELYGGSYYLDAEDGKLYDTEEYYNETGDPVKVNAYRCYFDVFGEHDEAKELNINFDDGDATAIGAVNALTEGTAKFYDLNGRQQNDLHNGVNIVKYGNGITKKVIIK